MNASTQTTDNTNSVATRALTTNSVRNRRTSTRQFMIDYNENGTYDSNMLKALLRIVKSLHILIQKKKYNVNNT